MAERVEAVAAMGLRGAFAQWAHAGAVGFVCLAFWVTLSAQFEQAREDRRVFRESVEVLSQDNKRQWQAIRELTAAVGRVPPGRGR